MATRKVIANKYMPARFPIVGTAFWLFLMHYYNVPGWVWGATGVVLTVFWIVLIYAVVIQKQVKPSEIE